MDDVDHRIKSVDFDLLTAEDIRSISAHEITESTLYKRGIPNIDGPNSLKLGVTTSQYICMTCFNDNRKCTGHSGHINLKRSIFHPCLLGCTVKCLRSVCYFCSNLLIEENKCSSKKRKRTQLNSVVNSSKSQKICRHCDGVQPHYSRSPSGVSCVFDLDAIEDENERKYIREHPFTAEKALQIMKHIPPSACKRLGITNPSALVLSCVLVPPPHIRPSVKISFNPSRNKGQDFLTTRLQDIVKINNQITKCKPEDTDQMMKLVESLFFTCKSYMDKTDVSKISGGNRSNSKFKSLITRIKGKRGRVRGNIQGKRVDFSSRSVITPDASIEIWELGIPKQIAMKQTIREPVYSLNMKEMQNRIINGNSDLIGCTTIVDPSNRHYNVSTMNEKQRKSISKQIKSGWKIDRFLRDGDFVCFNRQPTLHKSSMMGHSVKILEKGKSFRLNTAVCRPYNADFDGKHLFFFDLIVYIFTLTHITSKRRRDEYACSTAYGS